MGKTVSVSELDNSIEFIHTQFMKPLETVWQSLIDQYKAGLGCTKCMSECKLTQKYLKNE